MTSPARLAPCPRPRQCLSRQGRRLRRKSYGYPDNVGEAKSNARPGAAQILLESVEITVGCSPPFTISHLNGYSLYR